MAYTKTTWNNLSDPPINADNLNKIEQGIYNNSLGIDKINPSGTATTTAEIEEGQINDVIGFKSLKLKGQTSQYTTNGKNLWGGFTFTKVSNGLTFVLNKDGSINAKGTSTGTASSMLVAEATSNNIYITLPPGTYTLSGGGSNYIIQIYSTSANQVAFTDVGQTSETFTLSEETDLFCRIYIPNSGTTLNTTIKIQLESGSSETSYEPYTGKKASPNPDYPQDVNNVSGYNVVGIGNKNLIENETFVQGSHLDNTGTKRISCRNIKLKANTTYTFSSNLNYSTYNVGLVTSKKSFPIINGEQIYDSGWKTSSFSFTTGNDDVYANIAVKKVGELVIAPSDVSTYHFQIEKGSSATSYMAHQGNNFSIDLPVENLYDYTKSEFASTSKAVIRLIDNGFIAEVVTTATSQDFFFRTRIDDNLLVDGETYTLSYEAVKGVRKPLQLQLRNKDGSYVSGKSMATSITYDSNYGLFVVNNIFNESNTATVEAGTIAIVKNIQVERGTKIHAYTPYDEKPIELCKIGTYADYIYKKDGKWWKHKEIGKIVLNGTETWTYSSGNVVFYTDVIKTLARIGTGFYCDRFSWVSNATSFADMLDGQAKYQDNTMSNRLIFKDLAYTDVNDFKTWLSTNTPSLYYVLATPIEEEITYEPLIRQLDELYNSGLYDVTNISQDNSSEAFILDMEACKNNINGIVEYIRR